MTIKIEAPVIWLDDMSSQLTQRVKKYRAVPESDWRKLMKLVKAADEYEHAYPSEVCGICEALAALKEKGK